MNNTLINDYISCNIKDVYIDRSTYNIEYTIRKYFNLDYIIKVAINYQYDYIGNIDFKVFYGVFFNKDIKYDYNIEADILIPSSNRGASSDDIDRYYSMIREYINANKDFINILMLLKNDIVNKFEK